MITAGWLNNNSCEFRVYKHECVVEAPAECFIWQKCALSVIQIFYVQPQEDNETSTLQLLWNVRGHCLCSLVSIVIDHMTTPSQLRHRCTWGVWRRRRDGWWWWWWGRWWRTVGLPSWQVAATRIGAHRTDPTTDTRWGTLGQPCGQPTSFWRHYNVNKMLGELRDLQVEVVIHSPVLLLFCFCAES